MEEKYYLIKEIKKKNIKLYKKFSFTKKMRIKNNKNINNKNYKNHKWGKIKKIFNKLDYSRLYISINKRNIKYAFLRNKCKRIIRENFRINNILPGIDYYIIVNRNFIYFTKKEIIKKIKQIWNTLN